MTFAIVVPTIGRPSLGQLLDSLARSEGPRPDRVVVVDDRARSEPVVWTPADEDGRWLSDVLDLRRSGGRGPAAARNVGWRATSSDWVVFLDDDVLVGPQWLAELADDLDGAAADIAAVQGHIHVPLPVDRRPTDWERGTAGLATARWITADMACRRDVLVEVRGFDERFPKAFREDADLALRIMDSGRRLAAGSRRTVHPVRPAPWTASMTQQRGNADDALMRRLHGSGWYERAGAAVGRRPLHLVTTAAAATATVAATARRPRLGAAAASVWLGLTVEFAARRILPGPRSPREVATMAVTSAAIPLLATAHWLRGQVRHRSARPWREIAPVPVAAVLFDRDGTLIHDVPYNGDPALVEPMPGVPEALRRLRSAGIRVGVVTNQSGVARGLITEQQLKDVNARVDELLGPFDTWQVCPHADEDGCACRKPRPAMVQAASSALGVPVEACVVIGDTGADVRAGHAAGAATILVPNPVTRRDEIRAAPVVCGSVPEGVDLILGGAR